jgi:glycosyltransferase involved in cell wall biosynthesis
MKLNCSVIVITKNEAHNIDACLSSVSFCDDVIVVDAESVDDTVAIAKKHTQNVHTKRWDGFAAAKQFGLKHAKHSWVLWLDADERVMPELAAEIERIIDSESMEAAFTIARRAYFLGRWIRHSGWYPGRVARLFHKERATFNDAAVHEGLEIKGTIGVLKNDLLHFTDPNLFHYLAKFNRYTTLASGEQWKKGKKFKRSDLIIRPWWQFMKMYILRLGFLDGRQGLLLALFSSAYVFTKYAKLWERTTTHHT